MHCRQLGTSDLKVSEIALGSWLTYGVEQVRPITCIRTALDLGITLSTRRMSTAGVPPSRCWARRLPVFPVPRMCWRPNSSFP